MTPSRGREKPQRFYIVQIVETRRGYARVWASSQREARERAEAREITELRWTRPWRLVLSNVKREES